MTTVLRLIALFALLFTALPLHAHAIGVSRGDYFRTGDQLHAELGFARGELALAVLEIDANADGTLDETELARGLSALSAAFGNGLRLRADQTTCSMQGLTAALGEADGVLLGIDFQCESSEPNWSLRFDVFDRLSTGHRHLATLHGRDAAQSIALYAQQPELSIAADASTAASSGAFLGMIAFGIEHIVSGYDHLLFLLGLVVVGGSLRSVLLVVTAFTLAHSITLALAALQWITPGAWLVEPAIALTVVWVGVENWFVSDIGNRWRLTFPFGLIHGFGFAGALQEAAIAPDQLVTSLLAFNLGVESGQLLVLAAVLPLLYLLRRNAWFARRGSSVISALLVIAGAGWFVQRVGGF